MFSTYGAIIEKKNYYLCYDISLFCTKVCVCVWTVEEKKKNKYKFKDETEQKKNVLNEWTNDLLNILSKLIFKEKKYIYKVLYHRFDVFY